MALQRVLVANRGEIAVRDRPSVRGRGDRVGRDRVGGRPREHGGPPGRPCRAHRTGSVDGELPGHRTGSCRRRSRPDAMPSIRGTASWPSVRNWPTRVSRTGSCSSGRRATPSVAAATRSRPEPSPSPSASPRGPAAPPSRISSRPAPRSRRSACPVLLKAAAGGGGRGMVLVDHLTTSTRRFASPATRPSRPSATGASTSRSSSNQARHVEVQILARQPRPRRPPRRARLLGAAPLPEGRGGGAGRLDPDRGARGPARRRGGALRGPSATWAPATVEFVVDADHGGLRVPRGQHARPGRAPGHRAGHRGRHRP